MIVTLMAESEEVLKNLLIWVKEESAKAGLKLNIQKTKIMASSPITSWQIDGEKEKTVTDFIFLSSKITADGGCSHEIKRWLLLGRKAMAKLDKVLKSQDITLLTKVCIVKATVFPVAMYRCESLAIKKAEHWRTDAFTLWCWRRLLRVPWTARRSNQSINPEYLLEGLMLKLKLQYFDLMWRAGSLEKTLIQEEKGATEDEMVEWHHQVCANTGRQWRTGEPGILQSMGSQRIRHDLATEQKQQWLKSTEVKLFITKNHIKSTRGYSQEVNAGRRISFALSLSPWCWGNQLTVLLKESRR